MFRLLQQNLALLASKPATNLNYLASLSSTTNSLQSQVSPTNTDKNNNKLDKTGIHALQTEKKYPKLVKKESMYQFLTSWFTYYQGKTKDEKIPEKYVGEPHGAETATGEYQLFLLAFEHGILDPYDTWPLERDNKGESKDDPIIIKCYEPTRIVACQCEPAQTFLRYQKLYKNELTRCNCGFWMKLVDGDRFWEKIPKKDLLQIPFFRFLEEDGKLDLFLANKLHDDHGHHHDIDEEDHTPEDLHNYL